MIRCASPPRSAPLITIIEITTALTTATTSKTRATVAPGPRPTATKITPTVKVNPIAFAVTECRTSSNSSNGTSSQGLCANAAVASIAMAYTRNSSVATGPHRGAAMPTSSRTANPRHRNPSRATHAWVTP